MSEKMIEVTGEIPEALYENLIRLAKKRGVSANTVLQQAIESETYIDRKEESGATLLVQERDNSFKRVLRK